MKRLLVVVWFLSVLAPTILAGTEYITEEVCHSTSGCWIDTKTGECPDCVIETIEVLHTHEEIVEVEAPIEMVVQEVIKEVKVFNDLASLTYSVAKLPEGEYRMKTLVMNEGRVIYWTLPLKMTLQNIVGNVYVVKFSGRGKVLDNSIDCTKPFVLTFTLNHNNKQVSSSVLDGGSCPNIHTADQNVVWKTNEKGLKKIKTYSNGVCDVGPCDWITTKTNSYFYERI